MSSNPVDPDDLATVTRLLGLAGLPASEHETQVIAASYAISREQIAGLWALPDARYAEPALVFAADPGHRPWPAAD